MRRATFVIALFWLPGALCLRGQAPLPGPLTSCSQVRSLTRDQAARGLPVHIRGVVTLLAPTRGRMTIDDGTGIWVGPPSAGTIAGLPDTVTVGDLVELWGRSHEGLFSPTVMADRALVIGRDALPAARPIMPLGLDSGVYDSQRVSIEGVVQAAETGSRGQRSELRLVISTALGPFIFVLLSEHGVPAQNLVDAEVSLTGVSLSYFNSRRQFLGARIYTNDPKDLRILRPAGADAFAGPEVALGEVLAFSSQGANLHRRRVRGTVTLCKPGHYFYLQDRDHALRINTRQPDLLQPGDCVEATGFFILKNRRAEMHEAVFRRTGHTEPLQPLGINREQALIGQPRPITSPPEDYADHLVTLRGRLVSFDNKEGEPLRLNLECDGVLVSAEFSGNRGATAVTSLRPGSELSVSGICALTFSESYAVLDWPRPTGLRLLLRDAADVQVLWAASWWTSERLWTALGLTAVVLLIALTWVVVLRRTVTLRSNQLAEEMRARRDATVEFQSTLRERTRLAADLHDTTEQTLTGLAFQLEASEALQAKAPVRSQQHLALARHLLDRSREDIRRSIWNLRANPLEKNTLTEALREIAVDRTAGLAVRIVVAATGTPRPLPDFVAGNLLLLAQEGITNALKHARPGQIELRLNFSERELALIIRDDGAGFDLAAVGGPKEGHFGLQGMRERIKRLGGRLEIGGAPGHGTIITATVPE